MHPKGFGGDRKAPKIKKRLCCSIRLFAGGLRKNGECILRRGRPLLQGVPSYKTVRWTVLKFTPCGAREASGEFRRLRTAAMALPLTRQPFFTRKRLGEKTCFVLGRFQKIA